MSFDNNLTAENVEPNQKSATNTADAPENPKAENVEPNQEPSKTTDETAENLTAQNTAEIRQTVVNTVAMQEELKTQKEELKKKTAGIYENVLKNNQLVLLYTPNKMTVQELLELVGQEEGKLLAFDPSIGTPEELKNIKIELFKLQTRAANYETRSRLTITVLTGLLLATTAFIYFHNGGSFIDLECFFINAGSGHLIILGIFGAVIYRANDYISNEKVEVKTSFVANLFRVIMAIVFPIVLVSLLYDENGTRKTNIDASPEIISFCCGYSVQLAFDLLNKIVEKVSKMIKAL